MFSTALIRRGSVEEIVAKRARVLDQYQTALRLLADAQASHRELVRTSYPTRIDIGHQPLRADIEESLTLIRHDIDRTLWRYLRDATGLRDLMDAQSLEDFDRDIEKAPPEATAENLVATFTQLAEDADAIFRRGLVNVFSRLDRRYRSNDPFRLDKKLIVTGLYKVDRFRDCTYFHCDTYRRQAVSDLDRMFHILDGRPPKDHLTDAGQTVYQAKPRAVVETEYFRFRLFVNGNAHIEFKRADLVVKANRLIADHFGPVLAADRHRPRAAGAAK